jgi:hypothetical protein
MTQNRSHAVMAQRSLSRDDLDYFPTPPWGTRALMEHVLRPEDRPFRDCLEPACGEGHMARALSEYFESVRAHDIHDYGYGQGLKDFLASDFDPVDWIITNPPFNQAEAFIHHALKIARCGAAFLVRASFLESVGRYERLFRDAPPQQIAIFTQRLPIVKGRLDRKASSATSYAWLVWRQGLPAAAPEFQLIPPCRKALERDADYEARA